MTDLLWVQTEPKSSVLVDGISKEFDIVDYVSVEDNPDYILVEKKQIKVFFNRKDGCIVVHGHVDELDSVDRKIAFAFYAKEKNVFNVMMLLKKRLISMRLTPPSGTIDAFLRAYVNQNFIPFLQKKKLWETLLFAMLSFAALFFCKFDSIDLTVRKLKNKLWR